jgi:hypothetical protein
MLVVNGVPFPLHFRQLKQTDFPMLETILGLEPSSATLCAGDGGRGSVRRVMGRVLMVALTQYFKRS